jgi:hypothetical protein
MRYTALTAIAVFLFWQAPPCCAQLLTFDELPYQSVDDVSIGGVTFDFKVSGVDSQEAYYASQGPGNLALLTEPTLTGPAAGVLTILFDVPTEVVQFAVALNTADSLSPGFTVEAFDSSNGSLGSQAVNTSASGELSFSEGMYSYSGAPASKVVIEFTDAASDFAMDNLEYVIPEPLAGPLWLAAMLIWVGSSRRRI